MKDTVIARLNLPKKALLAAFGAAALALPLAAGVFIAPSALAQAQGPLAPEIYIGGARMPPPPAGTSAIEKGGSGPSLGLAEALRLYSESLQRGAPDYGVMTPRLQKATRESFGILVSDAKRLGAVRTVTFRGVDARGLEVYDVGYEHGTASYNAAPLVNGKLDKLAWGDVLVPGELPHSGTALALNKYVQTLQDGKPDYDDMTPALAANARESYRLDRSEVEALGAQITTAYKGGGMMGLDVFEVTFERGSRQWVVAMENGKLSAISGPHVGFWD